MMKKKAFVAHFVYNYYTYSGAAQQAAKLATHPKFYNNSIIFNIEASPKYVYGLKDGVPIIALSNNYIKRFIQVWIYSRLFGVKIYHSHGFIVTALLSALLLKTKTIVKTTMTLNDDLMTISEGVGFKYSIKKFLLKKIDASISLSYLAYKRNVSILGNDKCKLIPNGVVISKHTRKQKKNQFIIVGLVCERKKTSAGIEFFINNYASSDGAMLVIAGPRPGDPDAPIHESDAAYYNHCLNIVPSEYKHTVKFLGNLERNELELLYNESLAIIHLSSREGMPNAVIEAMSFNCVPITSDMDGVAEEIFENGKSGFVVNDRDILPLPKILKVSESCASKVAVESRFDMDSIVIKYSELYEGLL